MAPLDYPFFYDGVGYFGTLGAIFDPPSLWEGLRLIWSTEGPPFFAKESSVFFCSGPLYLSLQLLCLKLIGFSYPKALAVQAFICGMLCLLILKFMRQGSPWIKTKVDSFLLILLGIFFLFAGGIWHPLPGSLFDFRVDLAGSLLLTLALVACPRRDWTSALTFALAGLERFHNLSILIPTLSLWAIVDAFSGNFSRPRILRQIALNLRYPLGGIIGLILLRFPQVEALFFHYFHGYFGSEIGLRGFSWKNEGFFSFYPRALLNDFILWQPWVFASCGLGFLLFLFRKDLEFDWRKPPPLLLGSGVAFFLLTWNATRNNIGVLRFAWIPFLFYAVQLSSIILVMLSSKMKKYRSIPIYVLLGLCLWSVQLEAQKLQAFHEHFDYLGFRKNHYKRQLDQTWEILYQDWQSQPRTTDAFITMGANFNSDFNLNHLQWHIFLAEKGLPAIPFKFTTGWSFHEEEFEKEELGKIKDLNYLLNGSPGCGNPEVPLNAQYKEHFRQASDLAEFHCPQILSQITLESCRMELRKCLSPQR